jgi:hypothetical protein
MQATFYHPRKKKAGFMLICLKKKKKKIWWSRRKEKLFPFGYLLVDIILLFSFLFGLDSGERDLPFLSKPISSI